MSLFNNREIATGVWLVIFACWVLTKRDIRDSLVGLVRSFCSPKLLTPVCLMLLYVAGLVAVFRALGMWNIGLLKDTIVWFFMGAFVMMMRYATAEDGAGLLRKMVVDNIKVVIILEFILNTYTFSFVVELILVPALTFVATLNMIASTRKEYAPTEKITGWLLAIAGFVFLGIAVQRAVSDFHNLNSLATVQSIALAPLLSIGMLPFIYLMLVAMQYESLFIRFGLGPEKPERLKRYMRWQIYMHARFSLNRLRYLQRYHMSDLMHVGGEPEMARILSAATSRSKEKLYLECSEEELE